MLMLDEFRMTGHFVDPATMGDLPDETLRVRDYDGLWIYSVGKGWVTSIHHDEIVGTLSEVEARLYFDFYLWECIPHDFGTLCHMLGEFQHHNGLTYESAEETLAGVICERQAEWLETFIAKWEEVV